jgi:hypothetical protein
VPLLDLDVLTHGTPVTTVAVGLEIECNLGIIGAHGLGGQPHTHASIFIGHMLFGVVEMDGAKRRVHME